jgi:hypothetical protein
MTDPLLTIAAPPGSSVPDLVHVGQTILLPAGT